MPEQSAKGDMKETKENHPRRQSTHSLHQVAFTGLLEVPLAPA
jgi:hypothetical protein